MAGTDGTILYRLDPLTGALLSTETLPTTGAAVNRGGLSFESPDTIFALDDGLGIDAQSGFSGPITRHNSISADFPGAQGGDDNGREFIASGGNIIEYDPFTPNTILNTIPSPTPFLVEGMAFDGQNLYVSDATGRLLTLDPNTGAVLNQVAVAGGELIGLGAARFGNASLGLLLKNSIDTNDRLAQQTTLIAPNGTQVINGQTFVINDGVNQVTFEYEDPAVGDGVSPGNVEIRFKTSRRWGVRDRPGLCDCAPHSRRNQQRPSATNPEDSGRARGRNGDWNDQHRSSSQSVWYGAGRTRPGV